MKNNTKKLISFILAGLLSASSVTSLGISANAEEKETADVTATQDKAAGYKLADSIQEGTILHCFNWRYSDITAELQQIASAGFTSIQISPAQTSLPDMTGWYNEEGIRLEGTPWYEAYCPEELAFCEDMFKTREDLTELCAEADKYGINIIMDVIGNHMQRWYHDDEGDELSKEEYWHANNGKSISNYSRRQNITFNNIGGLTDLNTENEYIQQLTVEYLNDLKSMGVDGIRWDAAKHIALPSEGSDYWKIVCDTGLYNYGEILTGPTDDNNHDELMAEYAEYMSVTDSKYSENLFGAFNLKKVPVSDGNWTKRGVTADKLVYWGESHDTYSNDGQYGGTNNMSQNVIDRAYAVAAARADATSLYLSRPSSTVKDEIYFGHKGSTHFISPEISAVNHFHNAMVGKKDCYAAADNVAVITRENGGAVLVCGDEAGEVTVPNAGGYAVPGTYIDEVSGNTFSVTKDTITGTVGDSGIAVLYDSPMLGRLYAESEGSNKFYGEMSVTLRSVSVEKASYTLTETRNNEVISTETKDFTDGDVITFGKGSKVGNHFTLELKGTSINGREFSESYEFYLDPSQRPDPTEEARERNRISFDNGETAWSEVYVYLSCKETDDEVTNADFPGEKMTDIGNEYYTYTIPEKFKDYPLTAINVIFSDGKGNTISERKVEYEYNKYRKEPIVIYYDSHGMLSSGAWYTSYLGRERPENYKDSNRITFDNLKTQWDEVYIYISDKEEIETNDVPFEKMTPEGNNYFSYTIPESFKNSGWSYVFFSDGHGTIISSDDLRGKRLTTGYSGYGILLVYPEFDYWQTNFEGIYGDYDNDGKVTSKDALKILRYTIGYHDYGSWSLGDVNEDYNITAKDAMLILRYTINLHSNDLIGTPLIVNYN